LTDLPPFELGYPRTDLRRKLVTAVLSGEKTATAGLAEPGEVAPAAGTRYLLRGFDDEPVAIVEVTEASIVPAGEIDLQFARDEAEGFESVKDWHAAHERFFEQEIRPETLIAAIRFRVVERL
jgi:uncharacterized protein YhfF